MVFSYSKEKKLILCVHKIENLELLLILVVLISCCKLIYELEKLVCTQAASGFSRGTEPVE